MSKINSHFKSDSEANHKLVGRLLALDLGEKRVGVAISDEMQLTVRPLVALRRTNWKQLLRNVTDLLKKFDARGLVIGLPLRLDGVDGTASTEARRLARNFSLSLKIPVFLQDESLTSREAEERLRANGHQTAEMKKMLDSESAVIILRDFINTVDKHLSVASQEMDIKTDS